jgi:hypothetical protein
MSRKAITRKPNKQERIRREKDPIPWRYCLTTLACGLFLVVGFFGAARQHFSSIDYGIKNSNLRKQVAELEAENRRLMLSKEIAHSPGEIKKYAKKIGMVELSASNIEIFSPREEKNIPKEKSVKPLVEKTVNAKPIKETLSQKSSKTETPDGFGKAGKPQKNSGGKTDHRQRIVK